MGCCSSHEDEFVLQSDDFYLKYVYSEWKKADTDKDGSLSFKEIKKLLNSLNLKLNQKELKKKFKEADKDNSKELDFDEFVEFFKQLCTRPEIQALFKKLCEKSNKDYLTVEEFQQFLTKNQKDKISTEEVKAIIQTLCHAESDKIYELSFMEYMALPQNGAFDPTKLEQVYMDMKQPLNQYWISSSHNTYLSGDQIKGTSSIDCYITALEKGCRCVELDCWDGNDGQPVITHGHTFTSKISFEETIEAINKHAFNASMYPVILSLENHCSKPQQEIMAEIMLRIFDDKLPEPFGDPLPCPDELKGKIIIKGKMVSDDDRDDESDEQPVEDDENSNGENSKAEEEEEEVKEEKKKKAKPEKVAEALSIITHMRGVKFSSWEETRNNAKPRDSSSFVETKMLKLAKTPKEFIEYNIHVFSRTYPKGSRVHSSNYNPFLPWCMGCQIVALNYQTHDKPMKLYDNRFLDNGSCGYILKPDCLRNLEAPLPKKQKISLDIISGWQLPKESGGEKGEVIDSYVELQLQDFFNDEIINTAHKTKVVNNNGFNPLWNEHYDFDVNRPDLAVLEFTVMDQDKISKDDTLAYAAIPINGLKQGHRSIALRNKKGELFEGSSIYVRIQIEEE